MQSLLHLKIPKRSSSCSFRSCSFEPGHPVFSLLSFDKKNGPIRQDLCFACWEEKNKSGWIEKKSTYWKSKVSDKKEKKSSTKNERAIELFRHLFEQEPEKEEEIFLLGLLLMRARKLALREEIEKEGRRYYLYELTAEELFFLVKVIDLSALNSEALQSSLKDRFSLDAGSP